MPPSGTSEDRGLRMNSYIYARALQVALIVLAVTGSTTLARADIKDYEFQLVDKTVGKPVPNAVIFAKRLDMAPDGMETMKTTIEPMPSTEPGIYRFKAEVTMEGGWQLSLAAKVQGEIGTVENKLVIKATP